MSTLIAPTTEAVTSDDITVEPDTPVSICLVPGPGMSDFDTSHAEALIVRVGQESECPVGALALQPIGARAAVIVGAGTYRVIKRASGEPIGVDLA